MPLSWHWAAVSWHFRLLGDQCAGAWVAGGRGSHVAGARQSPRRRWTSFVSLRAVSQCGFVHLGVQCVCVAPAGQEFLAVDGVTGLPGSVGTSSLYNAQRLPHNVSVAAAEGEEGWEWRMGSRI